MAIWFEIALVLNFIYWAIFVYLLSRRRWNIPALAVGIFHMLFATTTSVAPIRSLVDPAYIGYSVGLLHFEKRAVALPAALILGWALSSAYVAVSKGRGRWMILIMVGDLFFALGIGVPIVLNSQDWKFQLGENFMASGAAGLLILLCLFALPFIASAIWAASRSRTDGKFPPIASNTEERRRESDEDKNRNGFRYAESRL